MEWSEGDLVWFEANNTGHPLPGEIQEVHRAAQVIIVQAVINGKVGDLLLNEEVLWVKIVWNFKEIFVLFGDSLEMRYSSWQNQLKVYLKSDIWCQYRKFRFKMKPLLKISSLISFRIGIHSCNSSLVLTIYSIWISISLYFSVRSDVLKYQ